MFFLFVFLLLDGRRKERASVVLVQEKRRQAGRSIKKRREALAFVVLKVLNAQVTKKIKKKGPKLHPTNKAHSNRLHVSCQWACFFLILL